MKRVFVRESFFSVPASELFAFHERRDAFELLTPPGFDNITVHSTVSTIKPSVEEARFTVRVVGIPFHFTMVHTVYEPPTRFVDEMLRGPFQSWKHEHQIVEAGWNHDPACLLRDEVSYSHPLLFAGNFAVSWPLTRLFNERHQITKRAIEASIQQRPSKTPARSIAITGGTGIIGKRITEILLEKGENVTLLVRNQQAARRLFQDRVEYAQWDFQSPEEGNWREAIASSDHVIHLAGTPLFNHRWTPSFKVAMKKSRTESTRQIVDAMRKLEGRPKSLISASAVGIYGTDPKRLVNEESHAGDDLLADICRAWEDEAGKAEELGVRTVQMRIGIVIDTESGALKEMLPLFKVGLGGVLGKPDHWINWVHVEDVARMFVMALDNDQMRGPINAVSPHPVTNKTFATTVAQVLRRPCLMRYPTFLLKLGLGESAEYVSGGPRASAQSTKNLGYTFFFDELEPTLRHLLNRPTSSQ
ncbi:MAG: TIGR01777 family protein [Proteobacteria bacterium]|jgi:uncharacterized protein|nr:TIGR01777 family protein [Pseudomonadota bacterium]